MRLYHWLLYLCPAELRREYGSGMQETFARRLADLGDAGRWRRAHLWQRELAGLLALAVTERWGIAARERRRRERALAAQKAGPVNAIAQDLRQAARRLLRTPTFTLASVLTLALGLGVTLAIVAVVYRVVLNPLPYGDSGRLVALRYSIPSRNVGTIYSVPARFYYEYVNRAHTLDGVALYWPVNAAEITLTGEGVPERIRQSRATSSLTSVLRVAPAQGRWFTEEEGRPGASPVAVLSHGLWVRRYGADPQIIGRRVTLDGTPTTIVGVMRPGFAFPDSRVDVWLPQPLPPAAGNAAAVPASPVMDSYQYGLIGRLRDGATLPQAREELTRLVAGLEPASPGNGYRVLVSSAVTLIDATVGEIATTLWILLAAVGLLLLVACSNVANLFLVRAEARQGEVAVRRAVGAGTRAIARYFLGESALLAIAGGVAGLALAAAAIRLLVAFGPPTLPRLEEVRIDGVVLAVAGVLTVLASLGFGSIPLLRLGSVAAPLTDHGRGNTASRKRYRARRVLMGGQIAMALVLLVLSGLMLRSFQQLRAVDPGFDPSSTLTFRIGLPRGDYPDRERMVAAHRAILDRLSALPAAAAVSASTCLPLAEQQVCQGGPLFIEGRPYPPGTVAPFVATRLVAGGYFEAMGMPVHRGRSIERLDVDLEEPVIVVNEALARTAFPRENPIGQRVRLGNPAMVRGVAEWLTIVGVVANTPTIALTEAAPMPQVFLPMFAMREVNMAGRLDGMSFVVRTTVPPGALTADVRRAVGAVDPNLALAQVRTLEDVMDRASAQAAFTMVLLLVAASIALVLGLVGVYGVISYVVTQRTGEIGVRLALGANPNGVAGMIVREGAIVAFTGSAIGVAAALAGSRLLQSLLYRVSPRDPSVFAGTTLMVLVVVLLACWLPARRAANVSPLEALRTD